MIKFYDIDEAYVRYLQTIDSKIPNIHYNTNNKFICGVVLNINGINYYAPISHTTQRFQTSLLIYDGDTAISSIRFSFMFPAYNDVLTQKNFRDIAKIDPNYANLISKEYAYCRSHEADILRKAASVYRIGCNPNHRFNYACCNFRNLEENYMKYNNQV